MSSGETPSGGDSGRGGGGAGPQYYFCYQCNRTVSITPSSSSSEPLCPDCNGGFLEEVENPSPTPLMNPFFSFQSNDENLSPFASLGPALPFFLSSNPQGGGGRGAGGAGAVDPIDLSALFGGALGGAGGAGGGAGSRSSPSPFSDNDAFNPFQFLQNYLQNMRAGGANIQFVIENNSSDQGGLRLPANIGDYFFGPGLEQLIQQLAENDPNRYGAPPASKSAVEALPNIKVAQDLLDSDSSQCAVCMDDFMLGAEAKQMPCKHVYHPDCILPWLELHNSCPVCRHELPTDDPDYEQRVARNNSFGSRSSGGASAGSGGAAGGSGESGVDGSSEGPQSNQTVERRFRITLPWLSRNSGSQAEGSNSGTSETREEELD